jgi:serine/threonine-protein kinase RsbW
MKRSGFYKRDFGELDSLFSLIGIFFEESGIPDEIRFSVDLSVEEVFTNLVKYNAEGPDEIGFELEFQDNTLYIRFTDRQLQPVDMSETAPVDLDAYHREGRVGGLGLHLVKQFMDRMLHEVNGDFATITLIKKTGN